MNENTKTQLVLLAAIAITLIVVSTIAGCAAMDGVYGTGKRIYIKGKEVVIQNADKLDAETLNALEKLDDYAGRYDRARETVREGK